MFSNPNGAEINPVLMASDKLVHQGTGMAARVLSSDPVPPNPARD